MNGIDITKENKNKSITIDFDPEEMNITSNVIKENILSKKDDDTIITDNQSETSSIKSKSTSSSPQKFMSISEAVSNLPFLDTPNKLGKIKKKKIKPKTIVDTKITEKYKVNYKNNLTCIIIRSDGTAIAKYENGKTAIVVDKSSNGYTLYCYYDNGNTAATFNEYGIGSVYYKDNRTLLWISKNNSGIEYDEKGKITQEYLITNDPPFTWSYKLDNYLTINYSSIKPFITIDFTSNKIKYTFKQDENIDEPLLPKPPSKPQKKIKSKDEIIENEIDYYEELHKVLL